MSASPSAMPGGQPSPTQPIAGPCDSPKDVTQKSLPNVLPDMKNAHVGEVRSTIARGGHTVGAWDNGRMERTAVAPTIPAELARRLREAHFVAVLTGAGVSAE